MTEATTPIHEAVREHYAEQARSAESCCGSNDTNTNVISNPLYPENLLTTLPSDVTNFSLGSGDPITPAALQPGETVLDLGSGGGLDCFLAARQVGETGKVIGVDMTPEMLERARSSAKQMGIHNVEFREGYLENLPVDDNSIDVVISNCVINLSPDKPQVIREIFRALKPGGRISVSDIVSNHPLTDEHRKNQKDWCGCIAGALANKEYVNELEKAGFVDIQVILNSSLVEELIDNDQVNVRSNKERSKDELKQDLRNWENTERIMFAPHTISARKPV